jgi:hypothetical protein
LIAILEGGKFVRKWIAAFVIGSFALEAGIALGADGLDACLTDRDVPRIARVVDPDGEIVYARVIAQRDGFITRARTIAPDGTPLREVFERSRQAAEDADFNVDDDRVCAVVSLPESELDAEAKVLVSTGLNYSAHAEEAGGGDVFLFPKPSAPTRPYASVHARTGVTLLDYEVELAFVLLEEVDPFDPRLRDRRRHALVLRRIFTDDCGHVEFHCAEQHGKLRGFGFPACSVAHARDLCVVDPIKRLHLLDDARKKDPGLARNLHRLVAGHLDRALHDGFETIDSVWIRPEDALDQFETGKLNLISPTSKNLQAIAGYESTESLLDAKRRVDTASIPTILPRIISSETAAFDEILDVIGYGGRVEEA